MRPHVATRVEAASLANVALNATCLGQANHTSAVTPSHCSCLPLTWKLVRDVMYSQPCAKTMAARYATAQRQHPLQVATNQGTAYPTEQKLFKHSQPSSTAVQALSAGDRFGAEALLAADSTVVQTRDSIR